MLTNPSIIYIYRSKKHKEYSIEKVFNQIEGYFDSVSVYMPFKSTLYGAPLNMIYFFFLRFSYKKNTIFHITGDVYYIGLVLPGTRSIITFHDCALLIRSKGIKRSVFYLLWYKWPLGRIKYITTISELVLRQLVKINPVSKNKITLIFNPLKYV